MTPSATQKVKKPKKAAVKKARAKKGAAAPTASSGSPYLVIVESPGKIKSISRFLGPEYLVKASFGHLRDLPKSKFGVDLEKDFEPSYAAIRAKAAVIAELKKAAAGAQKIFLAPDPDREGEAIAWHLSELLGGGEGKYSRITYQEITADAVREALDHPGKIDLRKVDAQTARRVLDRIVGYQLSPLLWKKVARGLSAGRVQSVALLLICAREKEILAFVPREFWTLDALFAKREGAGSFWARLEKIDGKKAEVPDQASSDALLAELPALPFGVERVEHKTRFRKPPPPFITSELQAEAARRFRWPVSRTMKTAQGLYEGVDIGSGGPVGLITYMRTDSYHLAPGAVAAIREYIGSALGQAYLPPEPAVYRSKKGSQEAHEAIRPTDARITPEAAEQHLTREQFLLYGLIWKRAVACQMAPARIRSTAVDVAGGRYLFSAREDQIEFPGFLKVYGEDGSEEGKNADGKPALPVLREQEPLDLKELKPEQKFTQPPPRYTKGTLVKVLEENGVGRPSTYAPTIETLKKRSYIIRDEGKLKPTELGQKVDSLLQEHFPLLINVDFTAGMEKELDDVEEGTIAWRKVVKDFYDPFRETMEKAEKEMVNLKQTLIPTDIVCASCGKPMVIRWGRNGQFLACSGWPECRNTKNFRTLPDGKIEVEPEEKTDRLCPKCGAPMAVKRRRNGKFLACSTYPACKGSGPYPVGVPCPLEGCGGEIVQRFSRKGFSFYGCSRYPDCRFVSRRIPAPAPAAESGPEEQKSTD